MLLLNQLLHLDSQRQLQRVVCLEVQLLLRQVDYLALLPLLQHQLLDNPRRHLRLFLEPLLHQ